jgi:hypothetical protein
MEGPMSWILNEKKNGLGLSVGSLVTRFDLLVSTAPGVESQYDKGKYINK